MHPVTLIARDPARADRPTVSYLCVDRAAALRVIAATSLELINIIGGADVPEGGQVDAPEEQEDPCCNVPA